MDQNSLHIRMWTMCVYQQQHGLPVIRELTLGVKIFWPSLSPDTLFVGNFVQLYYSAMCNQWNCFGENWVKVCRPTPAFHSIRTRLVRELHCSETKKSLPKAMRIAVSWIWRSKLRLRGSKTAAESEFTDSGACTAVFWTRMELPILVCGAAVISWCRGVRGRVGAAGLGTEGADPDLQNCSANLVFCSRPSNCRHGDLLHSGGGAHLKVRIQN